MTPLNHFRQHYKIMNEFYEWPRTRAEYNIFFKEVFRLPGFWSELGKKYVFLYQKITNFRLSYGVVTAAGDTAVKLATW